MGWQLKQYPLFSLGSSQMYDNLIILPLVSYMDDWLEMERKGREMGGGESKAGGVGGKVGGKWRGGRDELVTGRRENDREERSEGGEGGRERIPGWFSTVEQREGEAASGWTEGGMDGWRGEEEGWQGSPLASAATGTDGVPRRTEWVPVFTCGPMGKIRLPHTCSHTRGPGMLVQHYSKMKDVLRGGGGRWCGGEGSKAQKRVKGTANVG